MSIHFGLLIQSFWKFPAIFSNTISEKSAGNFDILSKLIYNLVGLKAVLSFPEDNKFALCQLFRRYENQAKRHLLTDLYIGFFPQLLLF
jgi:uncharacterized membrane protein YuzA (DUF378 family)